MHSRSAWLLTNCGVILLIASSTDRLVAAGDWPQILGPHRNGIADGERLNLDWPGGKPKVLWKRDVGDGVAGVAVADGYAVLFHRVGNQELVEGMDWITGDVQWKTGFPSHYRAEVGTAGDGPRCVPLIDRGSVYVFGAAGDLHCLALVDGKARWSRKAFQEFSAPDGYFGAGSTPIMEGGKLLVNVGGDRSNAGVVAFDRDSGKTIWTATSEQASYSAPTAATIDGVRHVIFAARLNVVSLDPDNGTVRFRFPFGQRGPTVNAATPLVIDGNVFVTASYGIGGVLAKIGASSAKTVWTTHEMASQFPTAIYKDGYLYGVNGRQDGTASLCCIDLKTGKATWNKRDFGMASSILADGKLLIMKTDGTLVVAEPDPKAFRQLASAAVLDNASPGNPALALPALANGLLYVRDSRTLKCLDLRMQP
jgi:outer membrane protein assembly factor BamB